MTDLEYRINRQLTQMAPHVRMRETAQLLVEARAEIQALTVRLDAAEKDIAEWRMAERSLIVSHDKNAKP